MNHARFGLPESAIEKINHVFALHREVEKATLYGSRAKGNYRKGSDIDLTLHGDRLTFDHLLTLMSEIDDLLLPYTIDLSIFAMLQSSALRDHIARVGQEFYLRTSAAASAPVARA